MKIGSVDLGGILFLAPMAGVSDAVYRKLCYEYGASFAVTEMVSAKGLYYSSEATKELLEPTGIHPEAAQIFGSSPEIMAQQLSHPYFEPFDIIDINMGCPARKIVSNNEGSALMKDVPLAKDIVAACVSATKKPVTVKIRAGWDSFTADKMAMSLEKAGAAAITVHGRTTEMGYSGTADLDAIRRVKECVSIPVIGNGDVTGAKSAERMLEYTGCDGIMIGRAAQGRPWIFNEIAYALKGKTYSLSHKKKLEIAKIHGLELIASKGERSAMLQMRKHMAWYTHGMRNAAQIRSSITNLKTREDFCDLIDYLLSLDI